MTKPTNARIPVMREPIRDQPIILRKAGIVFSGESGRLLPPYSSEQLKLHYSKEPGIMRPPSSVIPSREGSSMPITLKCGCGKHLKVRDELAGKRARCPGCGTILPVPSGITRQPLVRQEKLVSPSAEDDVEEPVIPRDKRASARRHDEDDYEGVRAAGRVRERDELDEDESSPLDDEPRRRHKKKKKRTKSVLFTPLLTLFGIDMTPLKLMIVGVVFLMAGFFAFMYFSGADAKVRVVDVYDLEEDLSEFCQGRPQMDVILSFLFKKQIPRP